MNDLETAEDEAQSRAFGRAGRKPGRKKDGPKNRTVITRTEVHEDDDGEHGDAPVEDFGTLFDSESVKDKGIFKVRVTRKEPDEGLLGYIQNPLAPEDEITNQWGGGTFLLQGMNTKGVIVKTTTLKIGRDPIFQTMAAESMWRRAKGLPAASTVAAKPETSLQDTLAMIDAREDKRAREAAERDERHRKDEAERDERRRKDEREFTAKLAQEAREWEARKAKDEAEREDRRRKDDLEREERRRRDESEREQRAAAHQAQMLQMVQANATQTIQFMKASSAEKPAQDGSEMLMKAVGLIQQIKEVSGVGEGGGGDKDVLTVLVENMPGILNGIGNAAGKAIKEIKGMPVPQPSGGDMPPGSLTIPPGALANMLADMVQKGVNPEAVIVPMVQKALIAAQPRQPNTVDGDPLAPVSLTDAAAAAPQQASPSPTTATVTPLHSVPMTLTAPVVVTAGVVRRKFTKVPA